MVAKLETIRKKIKQGKKLGFSERARAVNKGLLPSKAKKKTNGKNSKKVSKQLQKASKLHKRQSEIEKKYVKKTENKRPKSRNRKKA